MKHRNRSTTQPKRKLLTCALASVLVVASGHAIAQSSNATLRGNTSAADQDENRLILSYSLPIL